MGINHASLPRTEVFPGTQDFSVLKLWRQSQANWDIWLPWSVKNLSVPSGCLSAAFSLSPSPIHTFLILHSLSKNYLPPIHNFFKRTKIWTDISQKKICKRPISTWKNTQVQIKIVIALLCLKFKRLKIPSSKEIREHWSSLTLLVGV